MAMLANCSHTQIMPSKPEVAGEAVSHKHLRCEDAFWLKDPNLCDKIPETLVNAFNKRI